MLKSMVNKSQQMLCLGDIKYKEFTAIMYLLKSPIFYFTMGNKD